MLEIGRVIDAGAEQHDLRVVHPLRRDFRHRFQQTQPVIVHRTQAHPRHQVGEGARHQVSVLHHIGHARGRAGIVLQHQEPAFAVADDVGAANMHISPETDREFFHRGLVVRIAEHQLGRDHAFLHDPLAVVDIVQEQVERRHALLHPGLQHQPFGRRQDARNAVERQDAVDGIRIGINGEGNAQIDQVVFGGGGPRAQRVQADAADAGPHRCGGATVTGAIGGQLAEIGSRPVVAERIGNTLLHAALVTAVSGLAWAPAYQTCGRCNPLNHCSAASPSGRAPEGAVA